MELRIGTPHPEHDYYAALKDLNGPNDMGFYIRVISYIGELATIHYKKCNRELWQVYYRRGVTENQDMKEGL